MAAAAWATYSRVREGQLSAIECSCRNVACGPWFATYMVTAACRVSSFGYAKLVALVSSGDRGVGSKYNLGFMKATQPGKFNVGNERCTKSK